MPGDRIGLYLRAPGQREEETRQGGKNSTYPKVENFSYICFFGNSS